MSMECLATSSLPGSAQRGGKHRSGVHICAPLPVSAPLLLCPCEGGNSEEAMGAGSSHAGTLG